MALSHIITQGNNLALWGDSFNLGNYAGTNYPGALGSPGLTRAVCGNW